MSEYTPVNTNIDQQISSFSRLFIKGIIVIVLMALSSIISQIPFYVVLQNDLQKAFIIMICIFGTVTLGVLCCLIWAVVCLVVCSYGKNDDVVV